MRWFFLGFFLFAQLYLATRLWGGWRPQALARLLAIQLFFTPRLLFAGFAFSAFATVFAERLVRWIARPLSAKWLSPTKGLPAESELPLFVRVGETIEIPFRARRKAEHGWEPGWLILTDQRLFWLSGVWQMTAWEIDRRNPNDPIMTRLDLQTPAQWLAGFVVGMPPRIEIQMKPTAYPEDDHLETIAMADPQKLLEHLDPELVGLIRDVVTKTAAEPPKTRPKPKPVSVRQLQNNEQMMNPLKPRNVVLPERRIKKQKPQKAVALIPLKPLSGNHPLTDRDIQLPPKRRRV